MHGANLAFPQDWPSLLLLVAVGAVSSGINAVAGGGSLISFPTLTGVSIGSFRYGFGIPMIEANASNSSALWWGSLTGAFGFRNLIHKTGHYLKVLWLPTLIGSIAGAWLLISTTEQLFKDVVPILILGATLLLAFQPQIRKWATHRQARISDAGAIVLQFLVALYGGYFGAGMGIMMLAVFAIYMEGNIHEINAVKAWLGVIINFTATIVFVAKGRVILVPAVALTLGALVGGYYAAKVSQKMHPNTLRIIIAGYGFLTTAYFAYSSWWH